MADNNALSTEFFISDVTQRDSRPVVVFVPDWSQGNPYLTRLRGSLEDLGVSVVLKDYPVGLFPLNSLKTSVPAAAVIHVHWLASLIAPWQWSHNAFRLRVRLLLLFIDLTLVRLRGTRIVWTVHNLFEHESTNPDAERRARQLLARRCNHVIVHSPSAKEAIQSTYGLNISDKTSVIRHGNYDGSYVCRPEQVSELSKKFQLHDSTITVLYFGNIRRYKGVERLIDAFQKTTGTDLRLLVVGRPFSDEIALSVRRQCARDGRIFAELGFVPEDDVAAYFTLADAVAIPFEQTLSSGSAVLAMTLGKALIFSSHAKVLDLADENGAIYFDSDDSLTRQLQELDKITLKRMGQNNRQIAKEFTWPIVGRSTLQCYALTPHSDVSLAKADNQQL